MRTDLRRLLLMRALEMPHGRGRLCEVLGVTPAELARWIKQEPVPDDALEAAAELVLGDDIARALEDRRRCPRLVLANWYAH
ncbi:MAG: hypothetical protein ACT4P4_29090 [Betaproteobacteria bacterium]